MIRTIAALGRHHRTIHGARNVGVRSLCYEHTQDAVVQSSASGRPQSRMVRKMIKEIFGHPMALADCTVYLDEADSSTDILAVFHPCGSDVNLDSLGLGPNVREASQEEQSSISFWYTARVRIDHRVAAYCTELTGNEDSEHVKFGTYAFVPEVASSVQLAAGTKSPQPSERRAPIRLNRLQRKRGK